MDLGYAVRCAEQLRCSVVAQEFWRLRRPVAAEPLMSLKEHFGKAEETVSKFVSFPLEATTLGSGSHIFVRSFALGL